MVALEDEFWQVRAAALSSMSALALASRTFRSKCIDSITDMLTDEIENVRIAALLALGRLRHHIEFSETQLNVVLSLLDDVSCRLRSAVHAVLGTIPLTSPACLYQAIRALQDNIRRHPSDTPNIFKSLARLGKLCSGLAEDVTPRLLVHRNALGQESPYVTVQPDVEDDTYVAILVLVFSSAAINPQVLAMVPGHCLRHWRYLRHKYSSLIPSVEITPVGNQVLEFRQVVHGVEAGTAGGIKAGDSARAREASFAASSTGEEDRHSPDRTLSLETKSPNARGSAGAAVGEVGRGGEGGVAGAVAGEALACAVMGGAVAAEALGWWQEEGVAMLQLGGAHRGARETVRAVARRRRAAMMFDAFVGRVDEAISSARCVSSWHSFSAGDFGASQGSGGGAGGVGRGDTLLLLGLQALKESMIVKKEAIAHMLMRQSGNAREQARRGTVVLDGGRCMAGVAGGEGARWKEAALRIVELAAKIRCCTCDSVGTVCGGGGGSEANRTHQDAAHRWMAFGADLYVLAILVKMLAAFQDGSEEVGAGNRSEGEALAALQAFVRGAPAAADGFSGSWSGGEGASSEGVVCGVGGGEGVGADVAANGDAMDVEGLGLAGLEGVERQEGEGRGVADGTVGGEK